MPVWLITGGRGFLGRHVLSALEARRDRGVEPVVVGRQPPPGRPSVAFIAADLTDPSAVGRAIAATRPEVVLHLAGKTPPGDDEAFHRGNTLATIHLLDALRDSGRPTRVVLAGSAAEFGPVPVAALPVGEDYPGRPSDAYGLSKWHATTAGLAACAPLAVVVARIFNPIGPGLPATQAFGSFAARLAEPAAGPGPLRLTVGDLDVRRDFVDVRDVARALLALVDRGGGGRVYNVGTGVSHRVGDGLDTLIALSGRDVSVAVSPGLKAGRGPSDSRADIRRIVAEAGWRPEIDWRQSLGDLWDEARGRARDGERDLG